MSNGKPTEAVQSAWSICFTVAGHPEPQGSTRAFVPRGWDKPVVTSDNRKLKPWRQAVATGALVAMTRDGCGLTDDAVAVNCHFYFVRPKSVKAQEKITKPDIDKLLRGVLDALSGICFRDDAQVTGCSATKHFAEERGEYAYIEVHAASGVRRR